MLDLVLVAAVLAFAVSGYRQGFIVGILSFVGFLGGGVLGAQIAPSLADSVATDGRTQALVAIIVVFVAASLGQLITTVVGGLVRDRIVWRPIRVIDSAAGALVSAVGVLLVAWLVGTAVAQSPFSTLARQVRHSAVLQAVDGVVPDVARAWFASFRRLVDQGGFPQVFGGLGPERIVPVDPPDPAVLGSAAVQKARPSIVKVTGVAPSCSRKIEGTGFVYAPQHVMTNAHVVAGVRDPQVTLGDGGRTLDARVVLYDPERDVAVLYVPDLGRTPLAFAGEAKSGDSAIVAGFPQDGPFNVVAARIRGSQEARGPDIYQRSQVTRQIYSIYATVLPGNSGGPLLDPTGKVYGVVFAAAVDDSNTGYALTAAEVASDAKAGADATRAVSTQGCD